MYCGLLVHHMRSYAAHERACATRRRPALSSATLWKLQGDASFFVGDLSTTKEAYFTNYCLSIGTFRHPFGRLHRAAARQRTSHRLERPGPRVPWSVAAVQEELGLGYAHRYTDSRSHIKPEAKAAVEEAKLRYAALPPAGLVHEVAEIVEEESAAAGRPGRPAPAPAPRRHRAGTATRGCCLLCRACALPPPRASRSTAPKTVPTSDAPLRTAAAAVLQKFVGEGHGRRIFDDNDRDVKPADVQALRRALGLWHLDDKGRVGDER
ncbi:hypothetical protein ARSEF1564_000717 [Beauveria bassiana]